MTTANALARTIREMLDALFDAELVLIPNPISVDGNTVAWKSPTPLDRFVDFADYPTVRTYRRWAEAGEYTALLPDGALLQMRYRVAAGRIAAHRLAYVPCPYRLDQDMLLSEALSDVLDLHAVGSHDDVTMQSTVRFDFDPDSSAEGHPTAHLTLNVASCRIACESAMTPAQFVRFVFCNFYADRWRGNRDVFDSLPDSDHDSTIKDSERLSPHVAWRREVAT